MQAGGNANLNDFLKVCPDARKLKKNHPGWIFPSLAASISVKVLPSYYFVAHVSAQVNGIAKNTRSRRDMKTDFLDEDDEMPLMLPDKTVDPMKDIKRKVEEEMKQYA